MKTPNRILLLVIATLGTAFLNQGCKSSSTRAGNAPVPVTTVVTTVQQKEPSPAPNPPSETSVTEAPVNTLPQQQFSPGLEDLIKLVQSGIDESLLLVYLEHSTVRIQPTPEEIVYLRDIGTPESVIEALIRGRPASNVPTVVATPEQETPAQSAPPIAPVVTVAAAPIAVQTVVAPAPIQTTQTTTVIQYPQYYDSLAPYGSWIEVSGYGLCWRPTVAVVNLGWRPYSDRGRWLYSDLGWYWQSDYSWGWAPFHYGRWHQSHSHGWVWMPGTVWAPSWVSWRYTDQYCGWAPLPPEASFEVGVGFSYYGSRVGVSFGFGLVDHHYTFVGRDRFCDPTPWRHYRPRHEARRIYGESKVINNYIINSNNTVVNNGIGYQEIARVSRTDIRKVSVRDLPRQNADRVRPDRVVKAGADAVVYRPKFSATMAGGQSVGRREEFRKTEVSGAPDRTAISKTAGAGRQSPPVQSYSGPSRRGDAPVKTQTSAQPTVRTIGRSNYQSTDSTVRPPATRINSAQNSVPKSNPAPVTPVQRRERFRTIESSPSPVTSSGVSRISGSNRSVLSNPAPTVERPSVRTRTSVVNPPVTQSRSYSPTRSTAAVPSRATRVEVRKSEQIQSSVQRSVSPQPSVPSYTPPVRSFSPSSVRSRSTPVITPSVSRTAPTPSSRPSSGTITTTPSRQGPPPVQIDRSRISPSPRSSGGSVPSHSGSSANSRRGTTR